MNVKLTAGDQALFQRRDSSRHFLFSKTDTGRLKEVSRKKISEACQALLSAYPDILSNENLTDRALQLLESVKQFSCAVIRLDQSGTDRAGAAQLAANDGLVELAENLGFFVSNLDVNKLMDSFRVRAVHDGLAARLCCENISRKDIGELRGMAEEVYRLQRTGSDRKVRKAIRLDRTMHARTYEIADNPALLRANQSFWVPFVIVKRGASGSRHEHTYKEHLAILDAIEANERDEAERLARNHVESALRHTREQIEAGQADLTWYA